MRAALLLLALCAMATAQPAPTAEALYTEGQAAYDKHDFATAVARWQASYKLSGENDLLFNLAQAYRQNGQCKEALFTYRRFVAIDPTPTSERHTLADEFVRELAPLCGAPLPPSVIVQTASVDRGRSKRLAGIATAGAGVVLFAIGLGVGHHASVLGDEVTHACNAPQTCDWATERSVDDTGRHDATLGRVLDVVGVAAVAGGAALYYLGMRDAEVSVAPLATTSHANGAVISWRTSW